MAEWQPIETAPKDGRPFLALNKDKEVWVAKYIEGRLAFRTNGRYEPRTYEHKPMPDGSIGLVLAGTMGENYAKDSWRSDWTYWTRLYEFAPTLWLSLPEPPAHD